MSDSTYIIFIPISLNCSPSADVSPGAHSGQTEFSSTNEKQINSFNEVYHPHSVRDTTPRYRSKLATGYLYIGSKNQRTT
jgi:hypothetical protein